MYKDDFCVLLTTLTGVRQRSLTIQTNTRKALQILVQSRQERVHFSKRDENCFLLCIHCWNLSNHPPASLRCYRKNDFVDEAVHRLAFFIPWIAYTMNRSTVIHNTWHFEPPVREDFATDPSHSVGSIQLKDMLWKMDSFMCNTPLLCSRQTVQNMWRLNNKLRLLLHNLHLKQTQRLKVVLRPPLLPYFFL